MTAKKRCDKFKNKCVRCGEKEAPGKPDPLTAMALVCETCHATILRESPSHTRCSFPGCPRPEEFPIHLRTEGDLVDMTFCGLRLGGDRIVTEDYTEVSCESCNILLRREKLRRKDEPKAVEIKANMRIANDQRPLYLTAGCWIRSTAEIFALVEAAEKLGLSLCLSITREAPATSRPEEIGAAFRDVAGASARKAQD